MNIRRHRSGSVAPLAQRGIALVLVLWLTALLTVIAGGFAYAMRNEAQAARNTMSQAQARALADGAVARTVFELMRPADGTRCLGRRRLGPCMGRSRHACRGQRRRRVW